MAMALLLPELEEKCSSGNVSEGVKERTCIRWPEIPTTINIMRKKKIRVIFFIPVGENYLLCKRIMDIVPKDTRTNFFFSHAECAECAEK